MGNLCGTDEVGSTSGGGVTDTAKAVMQLMVMRDKLKEYQNKIEIRLENDRFYAKQFFFSGKRETARFILRKIKFQKSLLQKADSQMDRIGELVQNVNFSEVEDQVIAALRLGNVELRKMQRILRIEDEGEVVDETKDIMEFHKDIEAMISKGLTEQDEKDVIAELEALAIYGDFPPAEMEPINEEGNPPEENQGDDVQVIPENQELTDSEGNMAAPGTAPGAAPVDPSAPPASATPVPAAPGAPAT